MAAQEAFEEFEEQVSAELGDPPSPRRWAVFSAQGWRMALTWPARWPKRFLARVAVGLLLVQVFGAVAALVTVADDAALAPLAQKLRERGEETPVDEVEAKECQDGRSSRTVCEVRVRIGSTQYALQGLTAPDAEGVDGWYEPNPGAAYALPLWVRYLPGRPGAAMAVDDLAVAPTPAEIPGKWRALRWVGLVLAVTIPGCAVVAGRWLRHPYLSLEDEWPYVASGVALDRLPRQGFRRQSSAR